jgi:hypothetical protein
MCDGGLGRALRVCLAYEALRWYGSLIALATLSPATGKGSAVRLSIRLYIPRGMTRFQVAKALGMLLSSSPKRERDWVEREFAGWAVADLADGNSVEVLVDQPG